VKVQVIRKKEIVRCSVRWKWFLGFMGFYDC
jgi:hypothetical protein